uniref:hypothetical protein n=1 Tax=Mesorhizobium sp. M0050 TaxID=2956861 RepID=UPI00333D5DA1
MLVELDDLETTLTVLDALQVDWPQGVLELVPAARRLLVRFDTLVTDRFAFSPSDPVGMEKCSTSPSSMTERTWTMWQNCLAGPSTN